MIVSCPVWPHTVLQILFSSSSGLVPRAIDSFILNFPYWRNLGASGMGLKEIFYDRAVSPPSVLPKLKPIKSIRDPIMWVVKTIWNSRYSPREFATVHGSLFLTSGLVGLWGAAFKHLAAVAISEGAFVLANFVALKYHITLYLHAPNPTVVKSAVLGILSNVGYIVSHAMLMIGFHSTIAMVVCCLALSMGGIKILYDILYQQYLSEPIFA